MSETEQLELIYRIADSIKHKYTFDCYDSDDIYQQAVVIGIDGLKRYDGVRPLENFLRVHMKNRLLTFRRDFDRSNKDLPQATETYQFDTELIDLIHEKLSPYMRESFIKLTHGQKISQSVKEELYEQVRHILKDVY